MFHDEIDQILPPPPHLPKVLLFQWSPSLGINCFWSPCCYVGVDRLIPRPLTPENHVTMWSPRKPSRPPSLFSSSLIDFTHALARTECLVAYSDTAQSFFCEISVSFFHRKKIQFFYVCFHFISVRFWKKSDFGPVYLRQTPVRNLKYLLCFHRSIVSIFFVVFFIVWTKFCGRIWINTELEGILVNSDALFSLQWKWFVVKRPASGHFIYLFIFVVVLST